MRLTLQVIVLYCSSISFCEKIENLGFESAVSNEKPKHKYGSPAVIVNFDQEKSTASINHETFDRIFLHHEVKDRKIVIVTIVGALRKGKSFFMDYCLRFMYANVC